ncbi:hypothetical protein B6D12_12230 [Gilliamella apicola]|uniref:hypothetical protein n=1 Tax=Gilliamella apicola TaxID=1196095 RepID=UPI000A351470|nr:hypothetical protein [Gilliamella apicola]OTP87544.1 hypothetical protein B5S41_11925 [Gilliamella apicola]OTP92565.1 hypothetical protein B6D05_11920 [Gilliamella apicola]OTP92573.1 hypothetical protein B6D13_12255 [Gilliamella apicola]OTQ00893.1 hypothetical protein B6D07_09565 [Gilliamella apicola]OTQ04053.1 hypothetical protein B6D12_12230 [Gilliamella apicola]
MKKILLSLVCLALFGCSDDNDGKVTNEFLVGKWQCKLAFFSAQDHNGKLSDYEKNKDILFVKEYKLDEGKLYSKKDNSKDWVEMDIVNKYTGKTDVIRDNGFRSLKVTTLMTKKTDNQYFIKEEFFLMEKNIDNKNECVYKTNAEGLCTRIK